MPGKVKVKISSGKNLPVMDRSSDTTDAYVEIKLGSTTYKTDVCRKSLHPQWNTDWYRFEVDDSELQDEPLQIRLMDHDTYSANDAIGKVYLNLNPLLLPVDGQLAKCSYNGDSSTHHEISGWIPVYDTMHGIRGEVNVTVKVELFSDFNRYRQSSCGVQFFYSRTIPQGYHARVIHGFVEELLVNDDPEYQWIDKIRTPRASNEARQTLFFKLSGELQRKIGVKALNLGGNAVIGYRQSYDLEGTLDEMREEHSENYIKFVGGDKSFRLSAAPNFLAPAVPLPFSPCPRIPDVTIPKYKQLPKRLYSSLDSGENLKPSRSNPGLNEESSASSLKTLLKQEDKRGKPGYGLSQRLRNLKYSQNSLSKKMTALKSKLSDSIGEEIDEEPGVLTKRKTFKKTNSDSSMMAAVLARSVIQAHNSLSCILEVQNTPPEDRVEDNDEDTLEKLEPIENLLNKTTSETSIPLDENASEQFSSSETSSSYSDYDYDDETLHYTNSNIDLETISNIVKDGPNRADSLDSLSENVFKFPSNFASSSDNNLEIDLELNVEEGVVKYPQNLDDVEEPTEITEENYEPKQSKNIEEFQGTGLTDQDSKEINEFGDCTRGYQ
ncbi:hypothetical protein NQ318_003436 [Aromia moschata]|uniref:C2 domain-containing protein n=1 Tax=Aromia moschata TaxID=1265417 RepID=A0AAV8YXB6_9CUCU|nr:hypothetical protein NQ318_003436 [Aromia moschata]